MSTTALPQPPAIPRLHNGDHLTRDEFERRYWAMPPGTKAELIEGVVFMPSPVRFEEHGSPHAGLMTLLGVYRAFTPGVRAGDNSTVRLDLKNEPQPDGLLMIEPGCGGQALIDADGYVADAPELVAEVSASTVSIDRNLKLPAYARNGIREFVLWCVEDGTLEWFVLRSGQYDLLPPGADGILRSDTFPGLWLDAQALLRRDLARVLAVLQEGIATPEHTSFVARLQAARP
jgi:hypothetical protein